MKLNWFVYDQNMYASSSEVCGSLKLFSPIFGKCSEVFVWPSDKFWGVFGNLRKVVGMIVRKSLKTSYLIKKNYMVAWRFEISFVVYVEIYFTLSLPSLVKYFSSLLEKFCTPVRLVTSFTVYFEVLRYASVLQGIPNDYDRHYLGPVLF